MSQPPIINSRVKTKKTPLWIKLAIFFGAAFGVCMFVGVVAAICSGESHDEKLKALSEQAQAKRTPVVKVAAVAPAKFTEGQRKLLPQFEEGVQKLLDGEALDKIKSDGKYIDVISGRLFGAMTFEQKKTAIEMVWAKYSMEQNDNCMVVVKDLYNGKEIGHCYELGGFKME